MASQLRNTLRNGVLAVKWGISRCGSFATISQLRNGTRVPKGHFAAAKIFADDARRLRNHFAAGNDFRNEAWGAAKLFHSERRFSQRPFLGYEISQTMLSPCFRAPLDS
uniref:Uncharacterized protein n=1 Tax=Vitis vinifera TaxID=29760 RepID=A5B0L0_VITVI|nr:hypothetical protein VITISV_034758 [Vitis vinifera]